MALVIIHYQEALQFSCFTPDPLAAPLEAQCGGENSFFSAFYITDVTLPIPDDQFFFDPTLIFPASDVSPGERGDPQLFPNIEHYASLFLAPSKNLTFKGSGSSPMLIVRQNFGTSLPGEGLLAGVLQTLQYFGNSVDEVVFEQNRSDPYKQQLPVPTVNLADPSMLP
jgi:hypothetical protein